MNYVNDVYLETSSLGIGNLSTIMNLMAAYGLIMGLIGLLNIIELWKIYKKCDKPGWASIVPIYNTWVLFEISGLPGWLCLVPVANLIGIIVSRFKIPKRFGKSTGFCFGALFIPIIFYGILAFSKEDKNGSNKDKEPSQSNNLNGSASLGVSENISVSEPNINNIPISNPALNKQEITSSINSNNENTEFNNNSNSVSNLEVIPDLMAEPIMQENNAQINVVAEEKIYANEAPALNLEDTSIEMPIQPVINEPEIKNESVINAFEMPTPVMENQNINNNVFSQNNSNINNQSVDTLDTDHIDILNLANEQADNLELPKMVNEAINSDITVVKKCPNCGFDNHYSNKFCEVCNSPLE
jgi:hypothetical protein